MMETTIDLSRYYEKLRTVDPIRLNGRVTQVVGLVIESLGPVASVGELCYLYREDGQPMEVEVVGFKDSKVLLMPLGEMRGIKPGSEVIASGRPLTVRVGNELLGRVINSLGQPLDGKGPISAQREYPVYNSPPSPLSRERIREVLGTSVRAIDGLLTCGKGQRMGIFSGSGVGKSLLLGKIARCSEADVNVISLLGERGREVRDFLEKDLGAEGLRKSVVVVTTSDEAALLRIKGAFVASAIAEYFRDRGKDVVLMMDSLTRFAMAQREVGLAIGEPPTTRGYTPSVFAFLPQLLERSGTSPSGSITGFYTILVEADDMNDPIADSVRAILDGHIVLSRELASRGHYPAIDILNSLSRLMVDIVSLEHRKAAHRLRDILSVYREAEDLINIGAYVKGSNPRIDLALTMMETVNEYLRQDIEEHVDCKESISRLVTMMSDEKVQV